MALSPEEIESVREISLEKSLTLITTLVGTLSSAQTIRLGSIIESWDTLRFQNGDMIPNRDSELFYAAEEKKRQIRHTVRLMLGLPVIADAEVEIAQLNGTYGSLSSAIGGGSSGGAGEFGIVSGNGVSSG